MSPTSTQKFSGIFISYRRDDSSGHAGRLADRLVEHFGRNRIFVDIDTIEPGEDFVAVIENAVGSCDILIAVIGRNWLSGSGSGQLDNPNNFVRLEIATALRRDIRVIPVLVQRASMPKPQDLPEDLQKLTRRNAIEISDSRWQTDVDHLIGVLEKVLAKRAEQNPEVKVAEQPLVAEKTRLHEHRRDVDAEAEHGEVKEPEPTPRSKEDETAEERHVSKAPVGDPNFAGGGNRLDAPVPIVTPAFKTRRLMLIAGASLMVLLAATILIWRLQSGSNSNGITYAATPQPSLTPQPTPATPTPTPQSTPEAMAFSEPSLWKREDTGTIVQIVREGNTLRARVVSASATAARAGRSEGDLAFEGTYRDRTIKGKAYLLFTADDVSRCPAFSGEQPWDLKLTLSQDGNTLKGSRDDFELSDDCTIVTLARKKLTYNKILR